MSDEIELIGPHSAGPIMQMIGQCRDCECWDFGDREGFDLGSCNLQIWDKSKGADRCEVGDWDYHNNTFEDDCGILYTGPEFGCVHWEQKEGEHHGKPAQAD
jgi:hypothetical protein